MPDFKKTCDFHVEVKRKTAAAMLVLIDEEEYWIPFSQICDSSEITEEADLEDEGILTVSEWIAIEKGLE